MLEGGTSLLNMFYVADYLENHIRQASFIEKDQNYIMDLQRLQNDIKRSLPFAFDALIGKNLDQLEQKIQLELDRMQSGEKLFLPVGTTEHETLLVLKKTNSGKIKTSLFNTGDGVEDHLTKGISIKAATDFLNVSFLGTAPIKKSYAPIDDRIILGTMLKSVLDRSANGSMSVINQTLKNHLGEGKSGKAKEVQINGVCSFQVLSEVFEDILGKEQYLEFQHDLLNHVQDDFEELTRSLEKSPNPDDDANTNKVLQLHNRMLADNKAEIERIGRQLGDKIH